MGQKNEIDYYAFGMIMQSRSLSPTNYRFGFNGKEKDDDVNEAGNRLDFGSRIYCSRLGRWLSLDPLQVKYPSLSPYNFVANSPSRFVDIDGKDIFLYYISPGLSPDEWFGHNALGVQLTPEAKVYYYPASGNFASGP